jgi:DNA-binding SARP family transcriptional activator
VELHILGPVELWADGRRHAVGSPRQRGILALLAMNVRRPVPIDALIDRLWPENRPTRSTIHSYVARLRTALQNATDAARIDLRDHGYVLETDPDLIDIYRFRRLHEQADSLAESGQDAEAAALMREAAALRTGSPLADLRGAWAEQNRLALDEELLAASVSRIRVELRLGRHAALVGELTHLVAEYPFHQELLALLMQALDGCGQTARALEVYQRQRRRFVDELGTEPGRRVRELQQRLIAGDQGTDEETARPRIRRPNTIPRALADFIGRESEIERLLAACPTPGPNSRGGVIAIDGMPGVGKSTLALQLAHRLADSYPDARIHLDLGAHSAREPLDPPDALARLLPMVDVPEAGIPPSLDERADLWRTRLAERRAIIVLDDTADDDQVRYLLPGSSPSLVIITSRRRLSALDGVRPFTLDVMSPDDAARMLHAIITPAQADDDEATATVIRQCGALPLAIRLAATRLRDRPARTMRDLAGQLHSMGSVLGVRMGDRSVRVTFELSYRDLSAGQRRAFRLLSLHTGTEFTLESAAALLGLEHDAAVHAIDGLLDDNLLEERSRGGYRFHDLLREYARERTEAEDDETVRAGCVQRLCTYFLAIAEHGDQRRLERESSGILGYAQGPHDRQPELAHAIASFVETTARWNEGVEIHRKAMLTLRSAGEPIREAAAMVDLALVDLRCGRYEEAEDLARDAADVCRAAGDPRGEAAALDRLGLARWHLAAYDQALENLDASATICRRLGDRKGEATALAHSAMVLFHMGRYDTATLITERALSAYRAVGHLRGEIESLSNLGDIQMRLGRPEDALDNYLLSSRLNEDAIHPQDTAIDLANIGTCRLAMGETDEAFASFRRALGIYREIGDRTGVAEVLDNIGATYQAIGRNDAALSHHQNALRIARDVSEPMEECRAMRHIGAIYTNTGKYRLAIEHLDGALEIARRIREPYETGLILAAQGDVLHRTHRQAEARDRWTEAADALRSLGLREAEDIESRINGLAVTSL